MSNDRELGMNREITRRDFLEGVSLAIAGSMVPGNLLAAPISAGSDRTGNYPPGKTGLRGSHSGSFEVAHQLAREGRTDWGPAEDPDGIVYDLIVVGAGISGLSAAHFNKKENPDATILILDSHDDFGGHAKRNEFLYGGQKIIGYGGSQSLDGPDRFSKVAKGLLKDLQVDVSRFDTAYDREFNQRWDIGSGIYFDRKTYGVDKVVRADLMGWDVWLPMSQSNVSIEDAIPNMPISEEAKRQLLRLYTENKDQLPDHSIFSESSYLQSISYRDFLTKHMGVTDPQVIGLLQNVFSDLFGIDIVPAMWGMVMGLPGIDATSVGKFSGMIKWLSGYGDEPYIYHFPDGNASIARLLVRRLIPGVAPGNTMEDVVGAPFDYSRLDRSDSPVRLRLSSTAVHVRNLGDPKTAEEVEVTYVRGGETFRVRARSCVLACYNRIIPHICPELPEKQKDALALLVKVPLVYTNVLLRNWHPWKKLGIATVNCPGTYHRAAMLDFPVSLGSVEFSKGPDDPIVVHMNRIPASPGLPPDEQNRAGRMELLTTSFGTVERNIRTHLTGMLGSEGFDPALDIEGITVNRWPHGYAWYPNPLWTDYEDDELPYVIGRRRFGRIAIANSDAGGEAYLHTAIDQAHRALEDLEDSSS
jgi:spermidine dehydrogenase